MKAAELLDLAKARLELKSDYALAKLSGIRREDVPGIRSGKRAMPMHLIYWLAVTLERDPAELVAQQELSREKNPERLKFWNGFLSRAALVLGLVGALLLMPSGVTGNAHAANGGAANERGPLRIIHIMLNYRFQYLFPLMTQAHRAETSSSSRFPLPTAAA